MPIWGDFGPKKGSKNDPFFDPILGVSLGSGVPRPRDPRSGGGPKVVSPENRGGQLLGTWSETDRPKKWWWKNGGGENDGGKNDHPKNGVPIFGPLIFGGRFWTGPDQVPTDPVNKGIFRASYGGIS